MFSYIGDPQKPLTGYLYWSKWTILGTYPIFKRGTLGILKKGWDPTGFQEGVGSSILGRNPLTLRGKVNLYTRL